MAHMTLRLVSMSPSTVITSYPRVSVMISTHCLVVCCDDTYILLVPQFRNYLLRTIDPKKLDVNLLEGSYIPNLTAAPYRVTVEYANSIIEVTKGQSELSEILKKPFNLDKYEDKQLLGYYILIDLLVRYSMNLR